jgi:hypothetical protein
VIGRHLLASGAPSDLLIRPIQWPAAVTRGQLGPVTHPGTVPRGSSEDATGAPDAWELSRT